MSHGFSPNSQKTVEPAGGDIGEIEGGGAEATDAGGLGHDGVQGPHIARMRFLAAERHAGGDHGLAQVATARDADAAIADERARALFGPEFLVPQRLVDHAGDDFAVALERHRDAEMRNAVQEIQRAVQRIDDPAMMAVADRPQRSLPS